MNNERRIAEEALRESEQHWRSLIEALPQLVWSATPDGACDYFSTQWTEYTGVAESELLGWRWMDVLHPDDRQSTRQIWTDSVAGRRAYDVEYRVRRHDGTYGWFKTRGVPIRDSNGNIVKWFGSCTDINDRKRAEDALRESEQELRKARNELEKKVAERTAELRRNEAYLAEAQRLTRTGSWALTVATRESVHLSDQFYHIFGFDPERGMPSQQTIRQCIHTEDRPASAEIVDKALREGKGYELDQRIVLPEGTIKFIHIVARPVFNTSGDLVEFVGTAMDVTERKRAEYLTRQVFESSPDSMCIIGKDYRVQRVNPVFERFWRTPATTAVGMHTPGGHIGRIDSVLDQARLVLHRLVHDGVKLVVGHDFRDGDHQFVAGLNVLDVARGVEWGRGGLVARDVWRRETLLDVRRVDDVGSVLVG